MARAALRNGLPLALAAVLSLSACAGAVSPAAQPVTGQAQAQRAVRLTAAEQAASPSAEAMAAAAAASPDRLVDNPAPEPNGPSIGGGFPFWPTPPEGDLANFGTVAPGLYRGARPTEKGIAELKAKGVQVIVNLENDKKVVEQEAAWAKAAGIELVSIPLSIITPPKRAKIDQFLAIADGAPAKPVYFHCMQGRDRTGTAAFTYRISRQHWSYDRAYAEMVSYKFHTYLLGLRWFLVDYADEYEQGAAPRAAYAL